MNRVLVDAGFTRKLGDWNPGFYAAPHAAIDSGY